MVLGLADSVSGLPLGHKAVSYPLLNQLGQGSIDGCKAKLLASLLNLLVKLLGRQELLGFTELIDDRCLLPGIALLNHALALTQAMLRAMR